MDFKSIIVAKITVVSCNEMQSELRHYYMFYQLANYSSPSPNACKTLKTNSIFSTFNEERDFPSNTLEKADVSNQLNDKNL